MTVKEMKAKAEAMPLDEAVRWLCDQIPHYGISVAKLADIYSKRLSKLKEERKRLDQMCQYEIDARSKGFLHIGGIDEAGRGPLAGPVVAACVVLPESLYIEQLNDSKKLSSQVRDKFYDIIIQQAADYGIGMIMAEEIDAINILNAAKKAMMMAIGNLKKAPDFLIVDAVKLPTETEQLPLIKGDSLSVSVAAASILAKVTRDRWMEKIHQTYPKYGFEQHKGYGTREHTEAIRKYGLCPIHRRSFTRQLVDDTV